jgi:hypothetical protein
MSSSSWCHKYQTSRPSASSCSCVVDIGKNFGVARAGLPCSSVCQPPSAAACLTGALPPGAADEAGGGVCDRHRHRGHPQAVQVPVLPPDRQAPLPQGGCCLGAAARAAG